MRRTLCLNYGLFSRCPFLQPSFNNNGNILESEPTGQRCAGYFVTIPKLNTHDD
jgi:hypothetical protein